METEVKLRDMIDGNAPLMENFKTVTPGTYKHCIAVANLCESVGREVDVDLDSLTVAATLHDIGKCHNPNFFFENVGDQPNPHDELDPTMSYQVISRHVSDSVMKLVQLNLPLNVIKIVSEHHGNTLVRAIFNKAKDKYNGSTVEDHYRYKSSRPTTVESAILMCSDVVESACRSLHNNNKLEDHKSTIDTLINNLMDDEQLDILKLGELRVIKKVLIAEIRDLYHKRLDYDEEE